MLDDRIPVFELPPPALGGIAGFHVWNFTYHHGFSLSTDGNRPGPIAFRHRHPHFEIFWIFKGRGRLALEREILDVRPNSLLIMAPGDVHFWIETERLKGHALAVSELFTSSANFSLPFSQLTSFLQLNGSRTIRLNPAEHALTGNIFEIMRNSDVSSSFDRREVLKALLLILFSKIRGFHVGRGAVASDPDIAPLTRDFKQALLTECPRLTTVKEFAGYLKVSRSYLHRTVLRDTGRTPSDLIRDRVVFEAKRLLLHTDSSLKEITQHLGFRNASYFSSFFRRHTQLSPKNFRSRQVA